MPAGRKSPVIRTEILGSDIATTLTHMDYHTVAEGCGLWAFLDDIAKAPEISERALSGKPCRTARLDQCHHWQV